MSPVTMLLTEVPVCARVRSCETFAEFLLNVPIAWHHVSTIKWRETPMIKTYIELYGYVSKWLTRGTNHFGVQQF